MKFYSVLSDEGRRKKYAEAIDVSGLIVKNTNCSTCGREWSSFKLKDNISFALTNDYFPDFAACMFYKLLSDRALSILQKENIQHCSFTKVNILAKQSLSKELIEDLRDYGVKISKISEQTPSYYLINVKEGAKLHTKTKLQIERCSACGYEAPITPGMIYFDSDQPIYIDTASWDGSDLFTVEHFPAKLYCSEKFYTIYQKNQLTGLIFEEVEAISWINTLKKWMEQGISLLHPFLCSIPLL